MKMFYEEILPEATTGEIKLGEDIININFNCIIRINNEEKVIGNKENVPTLMIKDINKFNITLNEYLVCAREFYKNHKYFIEKEYIDKYLLSIIWANATIDDFNNPIQFLNNRIDFFKNNILNNYDNKEIEFKNSYLDNVNILIHNTPSVVMSEAPFCFSISIKDNNDGNLNLHQIEYGITNNECHIYSIHNLKSKETEENINLGKKIKKLLYKVRDSYTNNQDDTEYENIKEVTPAALATLTVFISILQKENINKIILRDYLPIRYLDKEFSSIKRANDKENREEYLKEKEKENDRIQSNLSDKFIRNFRRLEYHFNNIEIISNPFEVSGFVTVKLNKVKEVKCNNTLLSEIYECLNNDERRLNK